MKNNLERLSQTQKIEKNDASSCFVVVNKKIRGLVVRMKEVANADKVFCEKIAFYIFFCLFCQRLGTQLKRRTNKNFPLESEK